MVGTYGKVLTVKQNLQLNSMKKIITLAFILVSTLVNAQTFKFNNEGTADYVIYTVDKATANDLYTKMLNWVNTTYKNPDAVIKAKIENQMIRLEGLEKNAFSRTFKSGNVAGYDVYYSLTLEFQDGKYRVKYQHDKITVDGGQVHFNISDVLNNVPDVNGNGWTGAKQQYEGKINLLLTSIKNYLCTDKDSW